MIKPALYVAACLAAAALLAGPAAASPISYIFTGTAAGTLGGQAFSGDLTLTATGDTADIFTHFTGALWNNTITSVIDIPGLGPVTITNPDYVFDHPGGVIGFGVTGTPVCCDIIQLTNAAYVTYDLASDIGPLAYATDPSLPAWMDVPTTGGLLTLTRFEDNAFQAILTPTGVPEPGIASLFLGGLAGLGLLRRKRASV